MQDCFTGRRFCPHFPNAHLSCILLASRPDHSVATRIRLASAAATTSADFGVAPDCGRSAIPRQFIEFNISLGTQAPRRGEIEKRSGPGGGSRRPKAFSQRWGTSTSRPSRNTLHSSTLKAPIADGVFGNPRTKRKPHQQRRPKRTTRRNAISVIGLRNLRTCLIRGFGRTGDRSPSRACRVKVGQDLRSATGERCPA